MLHRLSTASACAAAVLLATLSLPSWSQEPPTLEIVWPPEASTIPAGPDALGTVGVVLKSNFKLKPAGQCGGDPRCGHVHLKVDPDGDTCNLPGKAYNSMNSDTGGELIKAHIGTCPSPTGSHVIGVLLADDKHQPVLLDGKPVIALRRVTVK